MAKQMKMTEQEMIWQKVIHQTKKDMALTGDKCITILKERE